VPVAVRWPCAKNSECRSGLSLLLLSSPRTTNKLTSVKRKYSSLPLARTPGKRRSKHTLSQCDKANSHRAHRPKSVTRSITIAPLGDNRWNGRISRTRWGRTRFYEPSSLSNLGRLKCCASFRRGVEFRSMPNSMYFILRLLRTARALVESARVDRTLSSVSELNFPPAAYGLRAAIYQIGRDPGGIPFSTHIVDADSTPKNRGLHAGSFASWFVLVLSFV